MQILRVQKLNQSELSQIVDLHYNILDESFLNNFGQNFLQIAYQTNVSSKNNIVILAKDKDMIKGFLVATYDGDKFSQEIIQNNFYKLSWEIFKSSILNPTLLYRIFQWKLKPAYANKIKPELQFIAIHPEYQGQGLGTKMLKILNQEFKKEGVRQYKVGTKAQNKQSNRFYKKLGFKPYYEDNFFGDDFNYYLTTIF